MLHFCTRQLLMPALLAVFGSAASASTLLLDVDGPVGSVVGIAGDGTRIYVAAATTFTMNQTVTDATLGMSILCRSCAGTVRLFSIPPTPNPPAGPLEAREDFVGPDGHTPDLDLTDIVSVGTLLAGTTYTMDLEMTAGNGVWSSSNQATFDTTYATPGTSFVSEAARITNIIGYPFEDVGQLDVPGGAFLYQISGTPPSAVPLPAGLPLVLTSLDALALINRRKRATGYNHIGRILYGDDIPLRDPNVDLNTDDPRIVDLNAFMSDLEPQSRSQWAHRTVIFEAIGYSIPVAKDGRRIWPTKFKREMIKRMRAGILTVKDCQKECQVSDRHLGCGFVLYETT